jgi:TetR/AcrR family fatty acid metabolism transcriptional regulator
MPADFFMFPPVRQGYGPEQSSSTSPESSDCAAYLHPITLVRLLNGDSVKTKTSPKRSERALNAVANGRSAEKYDRILEAAIAVFAEHGYFNSRISEIARRADVADGTIYLYFPNKEKILMAALDFAFSSFMRAAEQELATIVDPREKLRALARLHLDSLGANRGLAMVFQTEVRQSAKFLSEFSHQHLIAYFNLIRAVVREGQASGAFRQDVSDKIAANCFFGALDAMVTSWLLSEREYKLGPAAEALVDVMLRGMEAGR